MNARGSRTQMTFRDPGAASFSCTRAEGRPAAKAPPQPSQANYACRAATVGALRDRTR